MRVAELATLRCSRRKHPRAVRRHAFAAARNSVNRAARQHRLRFPACQSGARRQRADRTRARSAATRQPAGPNAPHRARFLRSHALNSVRHKERGRNGPGVTRAGTRPSEPAATRDGHPQDPAPVRSVARTTSSGDIRHRFLILVTRGQGELGSILQATGKGLPLAAQRRAPARHSKERGRGAWKAR